MKSQTPSWIFCCGAIRSGSTLQYQMAAELVEQCGAGKRVGFTKPADFPSLLEAQGGEPGLKVVKCHRIAPAITALFERGEARGIHAYRDVRAAMASLMNFRRRTFEDLFPGFVHGYLNQYGFWTDLGAYVMSSRYEDLIDDLHGEVRRIAQFLGLDASEELIRKIGDDLSLPRQRERMETISRAKTSGESADTPHDSQSLLHPNHISAGAGTGGTEKWRQQFEPEQLAAVEECAASWLVAHGYELDNPIEVDLEFESYAQGAVDHIVWQFNRREPGTFIEVGAFDGIHLSNTYALAQRGWRGLCIEPHPRYAPMLRENRPESTCVQAALVGPEQTGTATFCAEELGIFSGLHIDASELAERYERRRRAFSGIDKVQVPARTLDEVIAECGLPGDRLDFVSIDVEGTELDVLRGFDLERHQPELVVVEVNDAAAATKAAEYLTKRTRYVLARQRGVNLYFTRTTEGALRLAEIEPACAMASQVHPLGREHTIQPKLYVKLDRRFVQPGGDTGRAPGAVVGSRR